MRFLLDQNADRRFAPYLRDLGHDVTIVSIDYPPGIPDRTVLEIAHREGRIVLTNDRDVGEPVVRHGLPHAGVTYLRLSTPDFHTKRDRLPRCSPRMRRSWTTSSSSPSAPPACAAPDHRPNRSPRAAGARGPC